MHAPIDDVRYFEDQHGDKFGAPKDTLGENAEEKPAAEKEKFNFKPVQDL